MSKMYSNMKLADFAKTLGITKAELEDRLRADGYMKGNTQSMESFRRHLLDVKGPILRRGKQTLFPTDEFDISVTEKGQDLFTRLYGK